MNQRIRLFGIDIDAVRMPDAVARIFGWCGQSSGRCEYVVTPNVDHTVILQHNTELRNAYASAGLVLADGFPVVLASRWLKKPLPELVPGSDLVPALFDAAQQRGGLSIFLLGAAPGVADRAASRIAARWPSVKVVGTYSPPLGFERDAAENARILAMVNEAQPEVLVLGFGAPKQELWIAKHHQQLQARCALCVGATIDFLAGEKARAPAWMRRLRLEWFHRLATEPRRLFKRYARDAWVFPQLVWREWRQMQCGG